MDIRNLCRVCLGDSGKMFAITSPQLQEVYEKLAGTKLETGEGMSNMLCYFCYAQLRRCLGFLQAARRSNAVLTHLYTTKIMISQDILHQPMYNYSITPTECIDVCTNKAEDKTLLSRTIKTEVFEEVPVEINESAEDIKEDPDVEGNSYCAPTELDSDSDDDVPLNTLRNDPEIKAEPPKRTYKKQSKLDAQVVILTKEQQIQDVQSRATSLNYLNSPFPCVLCYRGFVNLAAYRNHKERHEESSGAHACDVCGLRYRTPRLLRTHAAGAHARLYRCNRCHHLSHTKHQAHDHERWHNGYTYTCQLCGESFTKRTSYLTHARTRHGARACAACSACGRRFLSRHGLRMHRAKAHSAPPQEVEASSAAARSCAECNVEFDSIRAWQIHILASSRHTLRAHQTKQCPLCGEQVSGSVGEHLKEHRNKLRPPPPRAPPPSARTLAQLTCEQCGSSFSNKAKLTAHVKRVHLGFKYNKNIVCEICGKKCTSNAALKYHQRTHTGERPHACSACGKRFADTNQLKIHKRTHTGEKPYSCEHCAKTFSQKAALNRHYRVHTGAKPYTCEVCAKSFSQSNSLKAHVRSVHLKMPQCRKPRSAEVKMDGTVCKSVPI